MASVVSKKRKNERTYYIAYRITGQDGKKKQKWYRCDSKKEAYRLLGEVEEAESADREYAPHGQKAYSCEKSKPELLTVERLVYQYVEQCSIMGKWEAKTRQNNLSYIKNYIVPYIGSTLITSVTPLFLQEYYNDLPNHKGAAGNHKTPPKNISARTVKEVHKILRPAFSMAVKNGEILANPAHDLDLPKIEKYVRAQLDEKEFTKALSACEDDNLELIMSIMFACTLRSGELAGITWNCMNLTEEAISSNTASISIEKEIARLDRMAIKATNTKIFFEFPSFKPNSKSVVVLKKPKTESSIRHVYIPSTLALRLLTHKEKQEEWKRTIGDEYHDFNLVFAQANGYPYSGNALGKRFKHYLSEKGIREVDFYSLRHSGATAKLRASKNIKSVQGDMGHSSTQMLMNVYAAIVDEDRKHNAAILEDNIFSKIHEKPPDETDKKKQKNELEQ